MKVTSLKKLIVLIMACMCTMLLASCGGVTIRPDDGGIVITPNEDQPSDGGNNSGNGNTDSENNQGNTGNDVQIEVHSHTYTLDSDSSSYSCTKDGFRIWRCSCGESFNETVAATGHTIRSFEGKPATCDTAGYEAYEKCINGNCDYTTYTVIDALGHDLEEFADFQPTCTTAGITDKVVCKRDGCTYAKETRVAALGHIRQIVDGKAATCTASGYYAYEICTRANCNGEGISNPIIIDALGHDNVNYEAKEPTCTSFGWFAYSVCQRCNHSTYSERSATGHSYVNGYCNCGHSDPGLHTHVWNSGEVIKSATCTASGEIRYTCTDSHCGDTKTEPVAPLGHNNKHYSAKAATCTAGGWYAYDECQRCGYSTIIIIPIIDHSYNGVVTTEPTCTMSGLRTYTCICGKSYTVEIQKLGHDWGRWNITKDATCETNGQEQRICYNDSNHVDIGTIQKIGHSWGDWTIISASTCVAKGQEKRTCYNDSSHAEIREIPLVDHKINTSTGICSVCNNTIIDRLDTPQNITEKGSVIYWNTVEGADHYEVVVDGVSYQVYSTKFDLENYYGTNYELQIKIRAVASNDSNAIDSAYYEYIFDIPTEPIGDYDGLGKTVNLLTGGCTETDNRTISIFDDALFDRLRVEENESRNSFSVVRYAETLHGYVDKLTTSLSTKVDMKISADYMKIVNATAGYSFSVETGYDKKTQDDTKAVFYDMDYYYTDKKVGIYGSNDLSILSNALSDDFLANAMKVQNGEISPETFINWYGTHIITSGVYGGSFNLHYEMISTTQIIEETFKIGSELAISSQVGAAIKGLNLKQTVDSNINTNYEAFTTNTNSNTQSKFTLVTNGGNITGKVCQSLADFSTVCEAWAEDLKNGEDYVLIDVDDGSLVFVWELLNDERYAKAKNLLYNYFYSTCDEQYYALKDKISSFYKDSYIFDETEGTMVIDFSALQAQENVALDSINYKMAGGTVVFDGVNFTVYPKFNGHDVKKVIFKGNYRVDDEKGYPYEGKFTPFTISFGENWSRDIVIEFENFAYEAPTGKVGLDFSKVDSSNITMILTGNNYIKGGDGVDSGQSGFTAIDATGKNLIIDGSGSIDVYGGNGIDGEQGIDRDWSHNAKGGTGENGGDGGVAIVGQMVNIDCSGVVSVIGGNGGDGGRGGNITGQANGPDQWDIPDGGVGGNGGQGGAPIAISSLNEINCLKLTLKFGNGGNGGDGGKGGDALESDNSADGWGHGGNAGHGGNGFIAGNGGNGGKGGFSYGEGHFADTRGQSGNGGNGGNGGNKILGITYVTHAESLLTDVSCGNGGNYGRRGDIDWNGVWGIEGSDGTPGSSGSIDDSYYNSFIALLEVNNDSNSNSL